MFDLNEHGVVINPNNYVIYRKNYTYAEIKTACDEEGDWYGAHLIGSTNWGSSSPVMFMHESFKTEAECVNYYLKKLKGCSYFKDEKEYPKLKPMIDAINSYQFGVEQGSLFNL